MDTFMETVTGLNGGTWNFLHQIDYGQMLICILLVLILGVEVVKLIFEAVRSWW